MELPKRNISTKKEKKTSIWAKGITTDTLSYIIALLEKYRPPHPLMPIIAPIRILYGVRSPKLLISLLSVSYTYSMIYNAPAIINPYAVVCYIYTVLCIFNDANFLTKIDTIPPPIPEHKPIIKPIKC
mmetsp:Transcript_934/g.103  ORF Transcript_934/g.103 Transcript_934/m.103 type:complete len:128 (+) Transcript_934:97-480(+)